MKLSICMMIKNEERNLVRCLDKLKPLVDEALAELIIVDTGSEDNSVNIAKKYTNRIYFHKWNKNFSEMRNISISYAKGEWLLLIDADERLDDVDKLIELLNSKEIDKYNTVFFKVKNLYSTTDESNYVLLSSPRMFKNDGKFKYTGAVHNQPAFKSPVLSFEINITHFGYIAGDMELMETKFQRTSEILKSELEKSPKDIYYISQLGVTYDMHGDLKKALEELRKAYNILSKRSFEEKKEKVYVFAIYAKIAERNGNIQESIKISKEGLKLEEEYVDLYYNIAMGEKKIKNEEESHKYFIKYLNYAEKYNRLKIAADTRFTMYYVNEKYKAIAYFELVKYYLKLEQYEKAYKIYNNVITINEKIYSSINILIPLKKYPELRNVYNCISGENDKNIFLCMIEEKLKNLKDEEKIKIYNEFSLGVDTYALLNKIRLSQDIDNKKGLIFELTNKLDFNNVPIFYCAIFEEIKEDIGFFVCILEKIEVWNLKNIVKYLIEEKNFTEVYEECILKYRNKMENITQIKTLITIADMLLLIHIRDNDKISNKYFEIFDIYIEMGLNFIQRIYKVENSEEIYKGIDNIQDRFFVIIYIVNKLIKKNNIKEAIKYMSLAVNTYKAFARYLGIYKDKIFNLKNEQNKKFNEYKIAVKTSIKSLIDKNDLEEAKKIISEYEEIVKDDVEILSMKTVIAIMENNLSKAENMLKKGLEIDESNFDLNYNLAYLYEQKENLGLAIEKYKEAKSYCNDDELIKNIDEIINRIVKNNPDLNDNSREKMIFFVKRGMDSFLEQIIEGVSKQYETKKVIVDNYDQIDKGMEWADICWFEWCDELIQYGSKNKLAIDKKIICRLHSYEAFAGYPANVNWNTVDKLIFVGENIRKFVIDKYKIDKQKTVVIPNGVDINKYKFKERKAGFNIAYVGYINYKKGPMLLLHTFKAIYDKDSRYKLYIAGQFQDDRDVLYYQQMIKEFGLENSVIYQGWQDNLDQWLEDKNYILCTSVLESQNMSVMQAMAKGIKPLVHNFVGAREIYNSKYVWNTIEEVVSIINNKEYCSKDYKEYIFNNYSLEGNSSLLLDMVNNIVSDKKPLVTVGIINYNYSKYIEESVNSVLNQNYNNIEIIIVDDFSKDESIEIIKNYENKYKNIRGIYHSNNSGSIVQGVQEIISEAKGKYFTFLSADDFFTDGNVIKKYVEEFLTDGELDYVYGNIRTYNEHKKDNSVWKYKDYTDDEIIFETFSRKGSGVIPFSIGLFKKEFYEKNNLTWIEDKNNRVAGDTLNTLINIKHGWKRKYIDYDIICYRQHDDNMTYDLENRVKSIISVMEYIVDNFSETLYLNNINWGEFEKNQKKCIKNYLIGINYYETFNMYLDGNGLPWEHKLNYDVEQIKVFLQPLIDVIEKYTKKSLAYGNLYANNIKNILISIQKYKINVNINKKSEEYILQNQIVCEGNQRKSILLQKYYEKYKNKELKLLIYSPSNGYWKYSFISWKQCLNYMGIEVDIVYKINPNADYSSYNGLIMIAEKTYIDDSLINESIYNIINKIGIVSKQYNNEKLDLINIQLCKKINFKFLISSLIEETNNDILCNWTKNNIRIENIPFGFNPLIYFPQDVSKIYDYYLVGSNSYLKIQETKKYIIPIVNKHTNGIIRGTGWGENIPEVNPNNSNFFYNRSNINLNYHLPIQKEKRTEINERTFIIASCGGFQLTDNPKMIKEYYSDNDMAIAIDQYEYIEMFEHYLSRPKERLEKSFNALVKTYEKDYSLFNRLEKILKHII